MIERCSYIYLGVLQLRGPLQSPIKESIFFMSSVLRTRLRLADNIKTNKIYAIALLICLLELIKWSNTDIDGIKRTIRT